MDWFWNLELIDSPVLPIVAASAGVLLVIVLASRLRRWWVLAIGAILGVGALCAALLSLQSTGAFDGDLPDGTTPWALGAGAGIGIGLMAIFMRPWWRRILAVLLVVTATLSLGLAVNALYGVTHTPATIFGLNTLARASLPRDDAGTSASSLAGWTPPADMPATGTVGALDGAEAIPVTGHYTPRPASLYLPPAALGANPPKLPVIVAMMGQPGSPDPTIIAKALNAYAASHHGVAPIAVLVDQLAGDPQKDPTCIDSEKYGDVATYVNTDTVAWIKKHLNVSSNVKDWAIAGYSNGGSCALQWGTEHPETWGAILSVSGNEYPGSEHVDATVDQLWHGDRAAYEAWIVPSQFTRHAAALKGRLIAFSWGSLDHHFGPEQQRNVARAEAIGMNVKTTVIADAAHTGAASHEGYAFVVDVFADAVGLGRFASR